MTKTELKDELDRLVQLFGTGRLSYVDTTYKMRQAVDIFTGDIVPVDWDIVAKYASIILSDGREGIFVAKSSSPDRILVLMNDKTTVTHVDAYEAQLVA